MAEVDISSTKYFNNQRKELLKYAPNSAARILEVGCGSGFFGVELIKERNAEVWGVEPDLNAASKAKDKLSKVINSHFTRDLPLPLHYFDCIVFNDVLEHFTDPWSALEYSKQLLTSRDGAVVIGSIPNFRFWGNIKEVIIQKDFKYKAQGILDKTHFRFFTLKSLKRFFEECGYEIVIIEGINEEVNWKFKLLNFLAFNSIYDMKFLQFAFVVKPLVK